MCLEVKKMQNIGRTKMISTTVNEEKYKIAKAKGLKHCYLWNLGFEVALKNPVLERVGEIERENEQRKQDFWNLKKKYFELVEKINTKRGVSIDKKE